MWCNKNNKKMARNIIQSEVTEMRENGFYIPNDRLEWEDMLKIMYYNDEGLTTIEIAYKIPCNTEDGNSLAKRPILRNPNMV